VPFYELGRDDGLHFYTMQLIDGISLADVIRGLRQCRDRHPTVHESRAYG
jgi:serine/threonine protein kinase